MPPNFRTQALDGNPCFVTTAKRTTKLGDCTDFTGHFAGYALTDYVSSDIHIFADDAAAVAAGCTLGEHPEKIVDCSAAVQEMKVAFSEEITLPPMEVPEGVEGALEMVANMYVCSTFRLPRTSFLAQASTHPPSQPRGHPPGAHRRRQRRGHRDLHQRHRRPPVPPPPP